MFPQKRRSKQVPGLILCPRIKILPSHVDDGKVTGSTLPSEIAAHHAEGIGEFRRVSATKQNFLAPEP